MDAWLDETCGLFVNFFGRETSAETYVVIALCILLGALALSRVGTRLGASGAFYFRGMLLTAIGSVLLFAAMAAVPSFTDLPFWASLIMAALVLLVVVVPLTALLQKGKYVTALIAWTVTLLTIGAILTLEPIVMRAIKDASGRVSAKTNRIEKYRIETEKFK